MLVFPIALGATIVQLEFAVLCDYAGYLANGQFVVVGPAVDSISADRAASSASVSLAGALRLQPQDTAMHTLRVDATGPEKSRFTVASDQRFAAEAREPSSESGNLHSFAVPVGTAFQSAGDYLLHLVIDGQDAKTLIVHVSQPSHSNGQKRGPSLAEIEAMYQSELEQWLELERMTPSEQVLQRIAKRFVPPREWFEEEDLFEPQAESD
jgi:hypothetical protein